MSGPTRFACACLLAGAMTGAWADIYMCVDAKGRRLTSDRPIPECADREQKEFNASGSLRRVVPPTPTATERIAIEARERKAAEDQQRAAEQKRAQKALVLRYPHQAAHDADRAKALQAVQDVIASGLKRVAELRDERKKLDQEAAASKSPQQLKRQIDDNAQQLAAQQRFLAAQEEEKKRITVRFDEELAQLKQLWAQKQAAVSGAPAAAPAAAIAR